MKQRALTDIQLTVLNLKRLGNTNYAISQVLGCHPDTVSNKWTAIKHGIEKGAYHNLPVDMRVSKDLFAEDESKAPTCDKCGAEITTGLMAAFCQSGKECEFYVEGVEDFMESVSVPHEPSKPD